MRNLKRALSLVLAVVMVIGLMVVGAGAVSYNDFPDRDEIVNKDAVSMLTTLGIIEGTDQGTYNPTGNVDRAQMAKMISVALTNNENCDTLYQNVNSGLTDIAANWARGYINYCYTLGIIAGRGDNTFDPSANVTGVEAAKMLLTALGYDANIEGLVGNDWALNTAALAQNLGIFRNFTKDVSAPLNRDDAALLIYNALDVELIQEYRNGYAISYDDHRTILSSVFGVIRVEGVVIGNEWAQLEETDSDAALQSGRTRLENVVWYDSTTANTVVDEGVRVTEPVTFNVTTPVDVMGKAVTLYVEKTTILSNSVVIGWTPNDNLNTVVSSAANQGASDDLLDGTGVDVDNNTQYYVNYGFESRADATELVNDYDWTRNGTDFNLNGVEVEVIDNDDDGTAEYVLYTRETLSNVVRTSSRDETTTINVPVVDSDGILDTVTSGTGIANTHTTTQVLDNEDIVTEMELAADDLILYVQYGGRTYITAPETVIDTMTRVDRDRDNEQYITLSNGDTYRASYIREVLSMVDADVTRFEFDNKVTTAEFDISYEWILDSNGYIVDFRPAEDAVRNLGLVLDSAWTQNALTRSGEIKILDSSAIEHTYTINWSGSVGTDKPFATNDDLEDYLGTRDVNDLNTPNYNLGAAKGSVIEYTLNEAGDTLTITNVFNQNTLDAVTASDPSGLATPNAATEGGVSIDVDNSAIVFPEANSNRVGGTKYPTNYSTQYMTDGAYDSGDGYLNVDYTIGTTTYEKTYAVDLNTVAFYYDYIEDAANAALYNGRYEIGDTVYGVATGWDEMGDVPDNMRVQVYPAITKQGGEYVASNLADVVLFNYELTTDTADWMLVLNANAVNSSTLELNVVFEDGTAAAIEVDRDDYGYFENNNSAYMRAYRHSVNGNGVYTVATSGSIGAVPASLLRDGTVDAGSYLTITGDSHLWDVTDVDSAEDEVRTGSFDYANAKNAVIIPTNNNRTIKTAWVWDMDGDSVVGTSCTFNWTTTGFTRVFYNANMSGWTWMQINEAFEAGEDVVVYGLNGTLPFSIDIPRDRILQIEGDLYTTATNNVTGDGTLRVRGEFRAYNDIRVDTYATDLYVDNDRDIYNDVHVQDEATLGSTNAGTDPIEIKAYVHLCARDSDGTGDAMHVYDNVDNYGHIETSGNKHVYSTVRDLSTNSIVVDGDIVFHGNGRLVVGADINSTSYTGNVTVVGGAIRNYDAATSSTLNVYRGTVNLNNGSSINLLSTGTGNIIVGTDGAINQTYRYNAPGVSATTIDVAGNVSISGDLVAGNGAANPDLRIQDTADVTARNINALPNGGTVLIETGARTQGTIAQGQTGTPVSGGTSYTGNYQTSLAETESWITGMKLGNAAVNLNHEERSGTVTLYGATGGSLTYTVRSDVTVSTVQVVTSAGTVSGTTLSNLTNGAVLTITLVNSAGEAQIWKVTVSIPTVYTITEPTETNFTMTIANVYNGQYVVAGQDVTFTVEPSDGYAITPSSVTYSVAGTEPAITDKVAMSQGNNTYTIPGADVQGNITFGTIQATQVAVKPTVTLKLNDAYSIDKDAAYQAVMVTNGDSYTVTLGSSVPLPTTPAEAGGVLAILSGTAGNSSNALTSGQLGTAANNTVTYTITFEPTVAGTAADNQVVKLTAEAAAGENVALIEAALRAGTVQIEADGETGGTALAAKLAEALGEIEGIWKGDNLTISVNALTVPGVAPSNPVNNYYTFNVTGTVGSTGFSVNACELYIDFTRTSTGG